MGRPDPPTVNSLIHDCKEVIEQYECGLIKGRELSASLVTISMNIGMSADIYETEWERRIGGS